MFRFPCDARGFFKVNAQFLGFCLDEVTDHPLADDSVGPRPQARAHKDILNVAAPHLLAINKVGVCAVTGHHAPHGDFSVAPPGALHRPVVIVENHLNACARARRSPLRSGKDEFAHRTFTPEFAYAPLAQDPADRVNDVGFSAAVGAHDAAYRPREFNHRGIGKTFKPADFELTQTHGNGT